MKNLTYLIKTIFLLVFIDSSSVAQTKSIILGRPTDTSITVSISFDKVVEYFLEYGKQPGVYTNTIPKIMNSANKPDEIDLHNLSPDTKYYYRTQYRIPGTPAYSVSPEYTFHTQRAKGSTFSFTIEADEHLYDKKGIKSL